MEGDVVAFGGVDFGERAESVSKETESGLADMTSSARVLSSARTSSATRLSFEQAAMERAPIVRANVRRAELI